MQKTQTWPGAIIVCIGYLLALASTNLRAEELISLPTRTEVKQRFILITAAQPKASVILFAGGDGKLELEGPPDAPRIGAQKNNFLVRTRQLFADTGFSVAVVDAPSDHQDSDGMLGGFRNSAEHVADIDQVIHYLTGKSAAPVWLIGTSRGTESAANVAIHSAQHPHGLVLTSTITEKNAKGVAVTEMALDKLKMPVMLLANTDDQCKVTPPTGVDHLVGRLVNATKLEKKLFSGGDAPRAKPCQALSYHGFLGREADVVSAIAQFIVSN